MVPVRAFDQRLHDMIADLAAAEDRCKALGEEVASLNRVIARDTNIIDKSEVDGMEWKDRAGRAEAECKRLELRIASVQAAASVLLEKCDEADLDSDLPDNIDGSVLDLVRGALAPSAAPAPGKCPDCDGTGLVPAPLRLTGEATCYRCEGTGKAPAQKQSNTAQQPPIDFATRTEPTEWVCTTCGASVANPWDGGHLVETCHPTWCGPVKRGGGA
jgi:hypothetical protein